MHDYEIWLLKFHLQVYRLQLHTLHINTITTDHNHIHFFTEVKTQVCVI